MRYSYTQVSQYLACPRRYRYHYLDGWEEREQRAAMLFGRAFEQALAAYFLGQDGKVTLLEAWSAAREMKLEHAKSESWQQMLAQGMELLEAFAHDDRVRVPDPLRHLQVKALRPLGNGNDFLGVIDAIGTLDGVPCLLDWKTTSSCYPTAPAELVRLDPQLICYSWMTGIEQVALVVFVRKKVAEIQYLKATITEAQRHEFSALVTDTVRQIEAAQFPLHSGIRFPQNQCVSCPYAGLCLKNNGLIDIRLTRRTGADFDWLDELAY